ncbi:DnaD domain protein [Neobacillus citreus]|uniref:DnaD domain protein n=2 Tax=Neobacillus citreus TaxID=2833578 RepID=A0A9J6N2E8_9BACI|nr:DnaD domain protein [Neobacillus citreus]MCH6269639.1 DnaD domain protein [Neobacillus citreus]
MAKYRMVRTEFWDDPVVEEMTPEEKYFYLYLLTNSKTTQIGIYRITKKQMAFHLGYSMETVHSLMERFAEHHQLIRYNPETKELAIKCWGEYNLHKGGKPIMDCITAELKEVQDRSLISYVSEGITNLGISSLYESFSRHEELLIGNEGSERAEQDTYTDTEDEELNDTSTCRATIRGQKEKENKKEKQKQQIASQTYIVDTPDLENLTKPEDVNEIIEFWDANGFGFTNLMAKQQLLVWLEDSSFLQPKEMILKAMEIACANNKRRLNYIVAILRNWENESLLTLADVDAHQAPQQAVPMSRKSTEIVRTGRDIPRGFQLDLTAGEEE